MGEFEKRIKEHIDTLCDHWKGKIHGRYYIDAYRCIEHNLLNEDVAGIEEAKKTMPLKNFEYTEPRKWNFIQYKHHYESLAHQVLEFLEWYRNWFDMADADKEKQ